MIRNQYSVGDGGAELMSAQWEVWHSETAREYQPYVKQACYNVRKADELWSEPGSKKLAMGMYEEAFEFAVLLQNYAMQASICVGFGYALLDMGRATEAYDKFRIARDFAQGIGHQKQAHIAEEFMKVAAANSSAHIAEEFVKVAAVNMVPVDMPAMHDKQNSTIRSRRSRNTKKDKAQPVLYVTKEQHAAADRNMDELLRLLEEEEESTRTKRANKQKRKGQKQVSIKEEDNPHSKLTQGAETQNRTAATELDNAVVEQLELPATELQKSSVEQLQKPGQPEVEKPDDQPDQLQEVEIGRTQENNETLLPIVCGDATGSPFEHDQPSQQERTEGTGTPTPHGHEFVEGSSKMFQKTPGEGSQPRTTATITPDLVQIHQVSTSLSRNILLQCRAALKVADAERTVTETVNLLLPIKVCSATGRDDESSESDVPVAPDVSKENALSHTKEDDQYAELTDSSCSDESSTDAPASDISSISANEFQPFSLSQLDERLDGGAGCATEILDNAGLQEFLSKTLASIASPHGLVAPPGLPAPLLEVEVKIGTTYLGSCKVKIS
jgi:hypothetical protein